MPGCDWPCWGLLTNQNHVQRYAEVCGRVHKGMQRYPEVHRGMQRWGKKSGFYVNSIFKCQDVIGCSGDS